jgi:hypothetical protein
MEVGGDSFENLCAYLGLPNSYHELVSSSVVFDLSVNWAKHEKVRIASVFLMGKVKARLSLFLPCHEDVWWSGCIA